MCTHVAICFHLGYHQRFVEFIPYIDNVIKCCCQTDLYITYREDLDPTEMCRKKYPHAQIMKAIKGCDTGAFLLQIKMILETNQKYDYIFKLHTKTNNKTCPTWSYDLLENTAGSIENVSRVIQLFQNEPKIGMIGGKRWVLKRDANYIMLHDVCNRNKITLNGSFIGGTIFWIRMSVIYQICPTIDLDKEYNLCEFGKPVEPSYTHAWERVFGLMVYTQGLKIQGV